jgi:hypothetical protein
MAGGYSASARCDRRVHVPSGAKTGDDERLTFNLLASETAFTQQKDIAIRQRLDIRPALSNLLLIVPILSEFQDPAREVFQDAVAADIGRLGQVDYEAKAKGLIESLIRQLAEIQLNPRTVQGDLSEFRYS